jgi:hypothetical protein
MLAEVIERNQFQWITLERNIIVVITDCIGVIANTCLQASFGQRKINDYTRGKRYEFASTKVLIVVIATVIHFNLCQLVSPVGQAKADKPIHSRAIFLFVCNHGNNACHACASEKQESG